MLPLLRPNVFLPIVERFTLNEAEWQRFNELLDRPPQVPEGLKELFSKPSVFED